jgi:hypothetical protein
MAQQESCAGLTAEDIYVDEQGRVIITNPEIAKWLRGVAAAPGKPKPNTNCSGCGATNAKNCKPNVVDGCGSVVNAMPNCACDVLTKETSHE